MHRCVGIHPPPAPLDLRRRRINAHGRAAARLSHRIHRNWLLRWFFSSRRFPAGPRGRLFRRRRNSAEVAAPASNAMCHPGRSNRLLDRTRSRRSDLQARRFLLLQAPPPSTSPRLLRQIRPPHPPPPPLPPPHPTVPPPH